MPIYEFFCENCDLTFEEIMSASEDRIPPCPKCHQAEQVQKCVSACARPVSSATSAGNCVPKSGFS